MQQNPFRVPLEGTIDITFYILISNFELFIADFVDFKQKSGKCFTSEKSIWETGTCENYDESTGKLLDVTTTCYHFPQVKFILFNLLKRTLILTLQTFI